ncbi:hypothetical protein SBOR_0280 [Sclerotinia borealis F-4128]|uniref:C2H2-type domain-containing protein n=1 Tax=Sclerotinia borealis (strain F-4128) TaxID=1432307 RepID=W9CXL6_SCLBF|nr:hypothetical protein SBOR_0280 [Sclerotinia borealis F-4128]
MSSALARHTLNTPTVATANGSASKTAPDETEANLSNLLVAYTDGQRAHSMERDSTGYSQTGLQTPYPHAFTDAHSEDSIADNTSAAQFTPHQEVRSNNNYSAVAPPTTSDFGPPFLPTLSRPANYPDHIQRTYQSASNHSSNSGGMAQPTSPSIPLADGRSTHQTPQIKSDQDVPIDPSIAASSPTYPAHGGQHSPYPQQDQMHFNYPATHPGGAMYTQPRPDWAGYGAGHAGHAGHPGHPGHQVHQGHAGHPGHHPASHNGMNYPVGGPSTASSTSMGRPQGHLSQIYSFVPIPGSQQTKRPRRRYEEIDRMYKCGYHGCEKAYGTLNHLNAHVTMQSHGNKRTPEEFKEIRKEWKARKKDEEQKRKEADSARSVAGPSSEIPHSEGPSSQVSYAPARSVQLPPIGGVTIGYQPGAQVPNQYQQQAQPPASAVQQLQQYGNGQPGMDHYGGYPASPYGAPNHMYNNSADQPQPEPKYEQ